MVVVVAGYFCDSVGIMVVAVVATGFVMVAVVIVVGVLVKCTLCG